MPVKNIIPGQIVTKEKLQRDPSVLRHLPQIRQCIFHVMIQSLNRRIWGRTGVGGFRNEEVMKSLSAVVGKIHELIASRATTNKE